MACQIACAAASPCAVAGPCVTLISAGAYQPPCGYSTNEPAPPASALPGFNKCCLLPLPVPRPWSRWIQHEDEIVNRSVEQNYATARTFVIDNNVHHQHNKVVTTTVNRRHVHTQRIITRENNFHHFNTDYVVKVNDLHTQRVEQLQAEGITTNDYRQTQRVEPATCQVTAEACGAVACVGAIASPACAAPGTIATPGPEACAAPINPCGC
jgi:hypothetical protein